ncbi:MAG: HAD family hydrolase [Firmicutes bacterium]|nr:HAD family hydrolase [Bacillota bacterium]
MEKAKAVIFDMDGTLLNTEHMLIECWCETAEIYGLDREELVRTLHACIGLKAQDTQEIFRNVYGEDFDYELFYGESGNRLMQKVEDGYLEIKPGACEILEDLSSRGVVTALGTSTRSSKTAARIKAAKMEKYFPIVVCGDMVQRGKPEPDVFLAVIEKLGLEPGEVFIVEDSNAGTEAAWRAGARVLMVPDILPPSEDTKQRCEAIFEDLFGVMEYLRDKV